MTDDQSGVEQKAEAPAEEVPASESKPEVVDQQQTETQESPETETGKNEVDVSKDNAAWAALRVENKRLKEVVEQVDPEYLNTLRNFTGPQPVVTPKVEQLGDDADYSRVTQSVNWAQQQAAEARTQIQRLQNQLELQQDRQAEEAFPELKTDKAFQQLVAEKKLVARVTGREVTTMDIAREVKRLLDRREQQITVQTEQATKQRIIEKQAATAEAKGQTTGGQSAISNDALRDRVRRGDSSAEFEVSKGIIADLEF